MEVLDFAIDHHTSRGQHMGRERHTIKGVGLTVCDTSLWLEGSGSKIRTSRRRKCSTACRRRVDQPSPEPVVRAEDYERPSRIVLVMFCCFTYSAMRPSLPTPYTWTSPPIGVGTPSR